MIFLRKCPAQNLIESCNQREGHSIIFTVGVQRSCRFLIIPRTRSLHSKCVIAHLPTRIPRLLLFHPRASISANETGMVRTRIGKKVFHTQASYGHEARDEAARQRKKRKTGCAENNTPTTRSLTTPSRALTRQTRSRMEEDESLLATPSKGANLNARRGNKKN